jgi:hypothetical protein
MAPDATPMAHCEVLLRHTRERGEYWRQEYARHESLRGNIVQQHWQPHHLVAAAPPGATAESSSCARLYEQEQQLAHWRREAGRLHCIRKGIGPTGGFCLKRSRKKVGGNFLMSKGLGNVLGRHFANASVLDVGAGLGQYGEFLGKKWPGVEWVGVDGAEQVEEATGGRVKFVDIVDGLPAALRRPFDYVMALEIAEHVPRSGEAALMHMVVSHARRGVVISWAGLGRDDGHHHTNCVPPEYVTCAFRQLGMARDTATQQQLRAGVVDCCPWLKSGVSAFVHAAPTGNEGTRGASLHTPHLLRLLQLPIPTPEFVKRYEEATRQFCGPPRTDSCNHSHFPRARQTHAQGGPFARVTTAALRVVSGQVSVESAISSAGALCGLFCVLHFVCRSRHFESCFGWSREGQ